MAEVAPQPSAITLSPIGGLMAEAAHHFSVSKALAPIAPVPLDGPLLPRTTKENFTSMVAALGTGKIPFHRPLTSDAPRLPLRALPPFGKTVTLAWQGQPACRPRGFP